MEPSRNMVLRWATIIGIIVILNLFFSVAIAVMYPEPQYEDFCEMRQVRTPIETEQQCVDAGGQWNPTVPGKIAPGEVQPVGYCYEEFTCNQNYQDEREEYERNVFILLVVLGIASLIGGIFTQRYQVVSLGLSYGGVLTLIIASIRYWSSASDLLRLALVGAALLILLYIAAKKFRE